MNNIIYAYFYTNFFIACFCTFVALLMKYDLLEAALSLLLTQDQIATLFLDPEIQESVDKIKSATTVDYLIDFIENCLFGLLKVLLNYFIFL